MWRKHLNYNEDRWGFKKGSKDLMSPWSKGRELPKNIKRKEKGTEGLLSSPTNDFFVFN